MRATKPTTLGIAFLKCDYIVSVMQDWEKGKVLMTNDDKKVNKWN